MSDPASSTTQLATTLFNGCWSCSAFNELGAIGLNFADTIFSQLASGMTILIGLFMALWVLWFAAKLFLPFGAPGSSHWNMGVAKLGKLLVVLAFLQTSGPFWNYIFIPILSTGLGIASQLATATDALDQNFLQQGDAPDGTYCGGSLPAPDSRLALSDNAKGAVMALEQMDCPLSKMQSAYAKGIMMGVVTIAHMDCDKGSGSWSVNFLPTAKELSYFVAGLILIIVYLFGFLVFPFLLIDMIARVILVAATSPLAIAATLFRPTSKIAERSVWTLVQCGFTLMFGAAVAGISKALIAFILDQMSQNGVSLKNWQGISGTMENACAVGFDAGLTSGSFYELVGIGIVTIFMMRRAGSLAAELTGISGSTGAQAAVSVMAGSGANSAGRMAQTAYKKYRQDTKSKAGKVTGTEPS